ncbi:MAG TPA: YfiR family protein [Patescibacteria group bacterium]|nr:YfiR family protein [Patescibacteria group bacterium]
MQVLKTHIRLLVFTCLLAGALAQPARGETLRLDENKIKAGLLYNFLKYTEWPGAGAGSGLSICLFGGDPFSGALAPLSGRTAQQQSIGIRYISRVEQLADCSAVVVHSSAAAAIPAITNFARSRNILTFSDIGGFASRGGMVEFARKDERVQVVVNGAAARAADLHIGARLLKVATVVNP